MCVPSAMDRSYACGARRSVGSWSAARSAVANHDHTIPIDPDRPPRRRIEPDVLAVIALGGIVGATARYGVAQALPTRPGQFPWATFWTNLSGSLVLGFLLVVLIERFRPTHYLRPFLATGILGAYTTMSTYAVETAVLIK